MSDFEFRTDNLEREQIRARNIEIAKQILDKVGISTDNPLYRDLWIQTMENVHNTFRFANYNEAAESRLIDLLSTSKDDIGLYKQVSAQYKNDVVVEQVKNASGSTYGSVFGLSYDSLFKTIKETMKSGMEMREELGTTFPDIFYDEAGVLRERVVLDIPYNMQESSAMGMIANYARLHEGVVFDRDENRFIVNGKPIGPEKFFRNKAEKLERFIKQLEADSGVLDFDDKELMDIVLEGSYKDFSDLRAKRGKDGDRKNLAIRNALADAYVFDDVQERLGLHEKGNMDSFMHYLREAMADYVTRADLVKREAEKDTIENIDRIMFTINPFDVATQSTFKDWNSCMHAVGCNHRFVDDSIGVGSIVAYGFDSSNPSKMVSRLLIHPFTSEKGEVAYNINPRIYGHENMAFRRVVESVVSGEFNEGKDGKFYFNKGKVDNGKGCLYNDGGIKEFYCFSPDEKGCVDFSKFEDKHFDLSNTSTNSVKKMILPQSSSYRGLKLKEGCEVDYGYGITLSDVSIDKGVVFNGEGNICISGLKKLGEDVKFPTPVFLSGVIDDGVDLRNIDNLIIQGRIDFGKNVKLPENICLRAIGIGGVVPEGMDLSKADRITFYNLRSIGENVKLPKDVVLEGMISKGIDLSVFDKVHLKDVGEVFSDIKLPEDLTISGNIYSANLKNVKKLTIETPKQYMYVDFPKDVFVTGQVGYDADLSNIENVVYTGNVMFYDGFNNHSKNFSFADDVVVSGRLFSNFDFSDREILTIKTLSAAEEGVKYPKKVEIKGSEGNISSANFSDVEELDIDSSNFDGDGVKFGHHVKAAHSNIVGCDLRAVKILELGKSVYLKDVKLSEELTIRGKVPHDLDYSDTKLLTIESDENLDYAKLSENVIIKGKAANSRFSGAKNVKISNCFNFSNNFAAIDNVELLDEGAEYEFGFEMKLPKNLKFADGSTVKGYLRTEEKSDISQSKDLVLVDCQVDGTVQLPDTIKASGEIMSFNDFQSCKTLTLFGNCKLGNYVKYPETVNIEDNTVLSGFIPDGLDLSKVKGLVLSEDINLGKGVKLPEDVKFNKGVKVSGYIPEGTDLSNVEDLIIKDVTLGKNVKIPDNCEYEKNVSIKGYVPENIDYNAVKFNGAIFTGHIPDGVDVGYGASLIGEVSLGKDVRLAYDTDVSEAKFVGDCCVSGATKGGDFSQAQSLEFSVEASIDKDTKFPLNGNVKFDKAISVKDVESSMMLSKLNLGDTIVMCDFNVNEETVLPNNLMVLFQSKDEEKVYGACPSDKKENMQILASNLSSEALIQISEYFSYDELSEKFGVKIKDVAKENERKSTIEGIKERLAQKGVTTKSQDKVAEKHTENTSSKGTFVPVEIDRR